MPTKSRRSFTPRDFCDRLSIADLLIRDDLDREPRTAFLELLEEVQARGEPDQVRLVCEKLLEQFPTDPTALRLLEEAATPGLRASASGPPRARADTVDVPPTGVSLPSLVLIHLADDPSLPSLSRTDSTPRTPTRLVI
ncbi:MAG: hypothetical protein ACE5FG_09135 [Myxococcota bacterium]